MKVDVEALSPSIRKLRFEIDRETLNAEIDEITREFRRYAAIPGFRKGKAPRSIVISKFSEEIKEHFIREKVLPEILNVCSDNKITPLTMPKQLTDLDQLSLIGDAPWVVEFEIVVKPDFELPPYDSIEIEKWRPDVPRENVENYLEMLRERRAEFIPLESAEDREAQNGDYVKIDISMSGEGIEDVVDEDVIIQIGQNLITREVDEGIIGMKLGQTKTIEAKFPEDHPEPVLAGKDVVFQITLKGFMERKLPELDDEFAKEMNYENLEQMKATIWNRMVEEEKERIRQEQHREVIKQMIEKIELEVPEPVLQERIDNVIAEIETGQRGNVEDRRILRDPERRQEFINSLREFLTNEIKRQWIFDKIAEQEGIEVSDNEVEELLVAEAIRRRVDPDKLVENVKKSDEFERLREQMRDSAVADFLIENVSEKSSIVI